MNNHSGIIAEHVSKRYGRLLADDNISLRVEPGELSVLPCQRACCTNAICRPLSQSRTNIHTIMEVKEMDDNIYSEIRTATLKRF